MNDASKRFLERLLSTPGVSGYEQSVQQVVREYAAEFADDVRTDLHGNVIASSRGDDAFRVMFDGHCDQLGMLVSHVDESGFLYFQTVGGWDAQQLVGQRVSVWTKDGQIHGVISRKAIHLLSDDEKKKVVEAKDMWIDIGASDEEDARSVVEIGDPVTVRLGLQEMRNRLANAPGMDNRTGVWVVFEAFRRAVERGLGCALFAASTVQEEIGLRGARTAAYGIDPHVAIAVDVTHATDCPTVDKRQRGSIDLGAGPVILRGPNINPRVNERLNEIAAEEEIPHQSAALGRAAPNDSNVLQITRAGVATGLVQIPNRYMHSAVETVSLDDLDHTADLLAAFAASLEDGTDFTP
ncbi:MAG: M42 family metallopeptidase [Longimicrobiales bacterium]|nr:M42 family metallopeptidase [Longimicrobiales bacterium]